jgi:hypothetical protein
MRFVGQWAVGSGEKAEGRGQKAEGRDEYSLAIIFNRLT